MTVRARLALTILLTSLATAAALIFTVANAFQRFEHERTWERANGFIGRVVATHPDLLALHGADPEGFTGFLRNLLLFGPDSRLYLLDAWRESPLYTARERAALAWTESLTLVAESHVPDAVWEEHATSSARPRWST